VAQRTTNGTKSTKTTGSSESNLTKKSKKDNGGRAAMLLTVIVWIYHKKVASLKKRIMVLTDKGQSISTKLKERSRRE